MTIRALSERGVYQQDIALQLGVHPKTVGRALKRGQAPSPGRKRRSSRLDPFKATFDRLLTEGVWNAVVILREIQTEGYRGGKTILQQYIAPKRALRPGRATVRFARPGGLGQGDPAGPAAAERLGRDRDPDPR